MTQSKTIFRILCLTFFCLSSLTIELQAQRIFALTGNQLVSFEPSNPSMMISSSGLSGISAGQMLMGIDFRPATGELYGVGYNNATGELRLYTIATATGVCTPVGSASIMVAPQMGDITFDFNPVVDRIRLMGRTRQSYRLHPVTGALLATDGMLAYAASDPNAGASPDIATGTYINSYIAATATTLFNYDAQLNVLTSQVPPNNGTQNTIGASGLMVSGNHPAALDGWFDPMTRTNTVYLAANTGSTNDMLYTINTNNGMATLVGNIGAPVRDIAVQINRMQQTLTGDLVYALTSTQMLVSFDAQMPGMIRQAVSISGVAMGQTLVGMDFRPATGELYAMGYNSTTGEGRLYTIQPNTGMATAIGTANLMLAPAMGNVGFDFNPLVDRIRVTTSKGMNLRLHPVTGQLLAQDSPLSFAAGDVNATKTPNIGAVAYINSFAGATSTILYNYDDVLNILTTQIPPNDGKLNTIGSSGIMLNPNDMSSDLDIYYDARTATNRAYLSANPGNSANDMLYSLNLQTGATTLIGPIGLGIAVVDIAVALNAEVACNTRVNACIQFEVLSTKTDANGNKVIRARITNGCTSGLRDVSFQVQNGTMPVGPAHNSTYMTPNGNSYKVASPFYGAPFTSVRFTAQNGGIKGGVSDIFEYTLPAATSFNLFQVLVRLEDGSQYSAYMSLSKCPLTPFSPVIASDRASDEVDYHLYPNPTSGTINLSTNENVAYVRILNYTGQLIAEMNPDSVESKLHQFEMPTGQPAGVYFLQVMTTGGTVHTERFMYIGR